MAFDVGALSAWSDERASDWILKPILGSYSMNYITSKYYGIKGQNIKLPEIDTTTPAQGGYGCGVNSSGTTTITQTTLTTVPFKVQEGICLNDLEQYFTVQNLPAKGQNDSFAMSQMWVNRKLQRISQNFGKALWAGKTTYTNDSWLKLQNGFIADIDGGSGEIAVTNGQAGTAITTSNVRTIFEEALFNGTTGVFAKPEILNNNPICFCGQDTFATLRLKLMQDNLYHVFIGNASSPDNSYSQWEMYYPGSPIKIVGIPELNSSNTTETGSLPTAVKNRIVITYQDNLMVGMAAEGDNTAFRVWYSQDDDKVYFSLRGFIGTGVKHNDLVVTY